MISMASKPPKTPAPPKAPAFKPEDANGGDAVVLERRPQKTEPPQMYQVVLLNDDYTPMEVVVVGIQEFFNKNPEKTKNKIFKN